MAKKTKTKLPKKKIKKGHILAVLVILGLGSYGYIEGEPMKMLSTLLPENSQTTSDSYVSSEGSFKVYFCPRDNCSAALVDFLDQAKQSIHCAVFELDLEPVQNKILEKAANTDHPVEVLVVTDKDYLYEFNHSFVKMDSWGLMHNKFCIVDGKKVYSGSMNPTNNCAYKNNNNMLLIDSELLAQNYEDEFQEMWQGTFKKGEKVAIPSIMIGDIEVKNYFCPEDACAEKVKEELAKAKESIYFMTFSFTNQEIANMLLLKKMENITIQGVMEARQVTKDSVFQQLEYQGIEVVKDGNKNNMHHKVFIVDKETVITGSFNPTAGGDTRNDENVLIIKDKKIAEKFMGEYEKVYGEAKS